MYHKKKKKQKLNDEVLDIVLCMVDDEDVLKK